MIGCSKSALKRIEYVNKDNVFEQKGNDTGIKTLPHVSTYGPSNPVINKKYMILYDDFTLAK